MLIFHVFSMVLSSSINGRLTQIKASKLKNSSCREFKIETPLPERSINSITKNTIYKKNSPTFIRLCKKK